MTSDPLFQVQVIMSGRDVIVTLWYETLRKAVQDAKDLSGCTDGPCLVTDDYGQILMTQAGDFGSVLVKSIERECEAVARADRISREINALAIPRETV